MIVGLGRRAAITRTVSALIVVIIIVAVGGAYFIYAYSQGSQTSTTQTTGTTVPRASVKVGLIGGTTVPFQYFAFYVAETQGFFNRSDINLDVSVISIADLGTLRAAIVSGEVNFAPYLLDQQILTMSTSTASLIGVVSMTLPKIYVWMEVPTGSMPSIPTCSDVTCSSVTQTQLAGIINQLKGKNIATYGATGLDTYWFDYMASTLDGLSHSDFKHVYLDGQLANYITAYQQGSIDAQFMAQPYSAYPVIQNLSRVIAFAGNFPPYNNYEYSEVLTSSSYAAANPGIVLRFVKAMVLAENWFNNNPDKAIQLAERLYAGVPAKLISTYLPLYKNSPFFTQSAVDNTINIDVAMGLATKTFTYNQLVTNQYVNEAITQLGGNFTWPS